MQCQMLEKQHLHEKLYFGAADILESTLPTNSANGQHCFLDFGM